MTRRLFAISVLVGLDLMLFICMYERGQAKTVQTSTTFYENTVALTFDDGPSRYTEQLLDGLKERGVVASFFVTGEHVVLYEDIIKRMSEEGHLIGNHTFSHAQLTKLSASEACEEVCKTCEVVEQITGEKMRYIRPPYGAYNEQLECGVDLIEVYWTVDPADWNTSNVEQVVKHVVDKAKDGDIILLHDIYPSSVAAALRIVDELKDRGFVFVTVDDILID